LIALVLIIGLVVNAALGEKINNIKITIQAFPSKLLLIVKSPDFIVSIIILILLVLLFLMIRSHKLSLARKKIEIEIIQEQELEEKNIRKLLNKKIDRLNLEGLENLIKKLEEYKEHAKIRDKIIVVKEDLERKEYEEYCKTDEYKKKKLLKEIEELERQKYLEELKQKCNDEVILDKLEPEENLIYEKNSLLPKEIEVLKKEEFKEVNEYDPIENKNSNFLVKQILNHSPTHTFLVGRIKQLLEKYINPKKVWLHETRDADITFEVKYKIYAFEIETGTLLAKKKNLKEKVSLLNNKYGQNWYFVVTNRDLAKKYREYGKVTTRQGVCKIIEKLIEN